MRRRQGGLRGVHCWPFTRGNKHLQCLATESGAKPLHAAELPSQAQARASAMSIPVGRQATAEHHCLGNVSPHPSPAPQLTSPHPERAGLPHPSLALTFAPPRTAPVPPGRVRWRRAAYGPRLQRAPRGPRAPLHASLPARRTFPAHGAAHRRPLTRSLPCCLRNVGRVYHQYVTNMT
jgi:hypothetical protein